MIKEGFTMSVTYRFTPPPSAEYAPYYAGYIARVPAGDIVETLKRQHSETIKIITSLTADQGSLRYAPGKWSVREVIGHVNDAERIFAYRALRVGRNDKTPLPGFEENDYVANGNFDERTIADLTSEFDHLRISTLDLFRQFDQEAWTRTGVANAFDVSVRALAWIIAGHELHHREILATRYLK
jgi:uncharacterized damage-inducible protein DinB